MSTYASVEGITWVRGTTEYLKYLVEADVELDAQPVYFTFDRDDPDAFITAEWAGSDVEVAGRHKRVARALVDDSELPASGYAQVFIKVTDNPEIPLIAAGPINVI